MNKLSEYTWQGYARKNGTKGIRNRLLIVYTVKCAEHVAREIMVQSGSREVELIGFDGCTDNQYAVNQIISLIRLLVSRKACLRGDVLAWEEDSVLELRDEKSWRVFAYAALGITVMVLELLISIHFGMMPRNRGDITVAEFSENYNRLAAYYKFDFGADLDEEGRWVMRDRNTESITIFFMENYLPEYEYTFEDGRLKDIRFHYETDTDHPSDCSAHMQLALLSFGFTDRDLNVVNNAGRIMKETVSRSPFKSFHYSAGGVTVDCQVNYEGYWSSYPLMPKEDLAERHYSMVFSISKD